MVGKATLGSSFSGLAAYLTRGGEERVAWSEPRYLIGTDPRQIAEEMQATAAGSSRVQKPVYHLSISFDRADDPTRQTMQHVAGRVLEDLGLDRHQAFLVAHHDREHPHLHIMVNRVDPVTQRAWATSHDYARIERSLRAVEEELGMRRVPGRHGRGGGDRAPDPERSRKTGEIRRERERGERPFCEALRDRVGAQLRQARSWHELIGVLKQRGIAVLSRERGIVFTDGQRFAKASAVDREASRFRLEHRFGQTLASYRAAGREAARDKGRPGQISGGRSHSGGGMNFTGRRVFSRDVMLRDGGQSTRLGPGGAGRHRMPGAEILSNARSREEPDEVTHTRRMAAQAARLGVGVAARLMAMTERRQRKEVFRDPEIAGLLKDASAYRKVRGMEQALDQAVRRHGALSQKLGEIPGLKRETEALSRAFDEALNRTYRDPVQARSGFVEMARRGGEGRAAEVMRRDPEQFGAVRTAQQKRYMGLVTQVSKEAGYREAGLAADYGRQYVQAVRRLPAPAEVDSWKRAVARDAQKIEVLRGSLARVPSSERLLARIGQREGRLSPAQLRRLDHALSQTRMIGVRGMLVETLARGREVLERALGGRGR